MNPAIAKRAAPLLALGKRVFALLAPVLFAVFPAISLFEQNKTELALPVLWAPLLISVVVAVVLHLIFLLIFKSGAKAGALASLCVVAFFYYGIVSEKIFGAGPSDGWQIALWIALFVVCAIALVRTQVRLENLTKILSVGAVVLTVFPAVNLTRYKLDNPSVSLTDSRLWSSPLAAPTAPSGATLPDIYFLIPDDYARPDVLKRYFKFNDSEFLNQLKQRGFRISQDVRSPYSHSEMNIASTVNLDYLTGLGDILGSQSEDIASARRLIESNRAAPLLESLGYQYTHIDSDEVTYEAGNPEISPVATTDSFMTIWMEDSILGQFGGRFGFDASATDQRFRDAVIFAFGRLSDSTQQPGPKFVLFHTLLPHDPFVFQPNGQPLSFTDVSGEDHTKKIGMPYYLKQLQFLNRELLDAVDTILANSTTPPIILIQADEGFESNEEDWGEAAVRDMRVKGLAAFLLPGKQNVALPPRLNTVNTLRFVFNTYFKTGYPLLKNSSYPELDFPYQFEEKLHVR